MAPGPRPLLVATRNPGKVREIAAALEGLDVRVVLPDELPGPLPEVEESGETLLENAQRKARAWAEASGLLALADDSGLEVEALDGAPGVRSARWSGGGPEANNALLLSSLEGVEDARRGALFRTVLVAAEPGGREDWASGSCRGSILRAPRGQEGFGYDPLFFVPEAGKTFAEMSLKEKDFHGHRGKALRRMRLLLSRW